MNDFFAAIEFMQRYPQATGKVGITGFCYGGGVSNAAAVAYPELACAVPFYGRQAPTADVAKIEAPLLLHFAELDTRINEGWPAYEAALKANNKVYEAGNDSNLLIVFYVQRAFTDKQQIKRKAQSFD